MSKNLRYKSLLVAYAVMLASSSSHAKAANDFDVSALLGFSESNDSNDIELEYDEMIEEYVKEHIDRINVLLDDNIIESKNLEVDEYKEQLKEHTSAIGYAQQIEMFKTYIYEYSYYFNFDGDKVNELIASLTNNYTEKYPIGIGKKSYDLEDMEAYAIAVNYILFSKDKQLGVNKKDYVVSNEVVHFTYDDNGKIIMREGSDFASFLGHVADTIGIDKALVLAISDAETGGRTNKQSINQNNFGGIGGVGNFITYPSPEAGAVALVCVVETMMNSHNFRGLSQLSGYYVHGDASSTAPIWISNVRSAYKRYSEDLYGTFEANYNPKQLILKSDFASFKEDESN